MPVTESYRPTPLDGTRRWNRRRAFDTPKDASRSQRDSMRCEQTDERRSRGSPFEPMRGEFSSIAAHGRQRSSHYKTARSCNSRGPDPFHTRRGLRRSTGIDPGVLDPPRVRGASVPKDFQPRTRPWQIQSTLRKSDSDVDASSHRDHMCSQRRHVVCKHIPEVAKERFGDPRPKRRRRPHRCQREREEQPKETNALRPIAETSERLHVTRLRIEKRPEGLVIRLIEMACQLKEVVYDPSDPTRDSPCALSGAPDQRSHSWSSHAVTREVTSRTKPNSREARSTS